MAWRCHLYSHVCGAVVLRLKRTNSGRLVLTEAGGVDLTATDRDKARQLKKQRKKLGLVNFAAQQLREAIWETVRRHRKESGVSERKALAKVFQRLDVQRTGWVSWWGCMAGRLKQRSGSHGEGCVRVEPGTWASRNCGRHLRCGLLAHARRVTSATLCQAMWGVRVSVREAQSGSWLLFPCTSVEQTMVSVDHVPKEDMKVLLECFDANNDGRIDFEEFESFVRWEPEGGEELGVLAVKIRTRFLLVRMPRALLGLSMGCPISLYCVGCAMPSLRGATERARS